MRSLELRDFFKLSQIIDKLDISNDLAEMFGKAKGNNKKDMDTLNNQVFLLIASKLYRAEAPAYEFIASVTGDSIEIVEAYSFDKIKEFFNALLTTEGIQDFFESTVTEKLQAVK